MNRLHKYQYLILKYLSEKNEPVVMDMIIKELSIDQVFASSHSQVLSKGGLLDVREEGYLRVKLKELGLSYKENGLPERQVISALSKNGGCASIKEIPDLTGLTQKEVGNSLKALKQKGWAENKKGTLTLTASGESALLEECKEKEFFQSLCSEYTAFYSPDTMPKEAKESLKALKPRKEIIAVKESKRKFVSLTEAGKELVKNGILPIEEVSLLTSEMLASGSWRDAEFRSYDVNAGTAPVYPGKLHPFRKVLQETKDIFLSLGFQEAESSYVDSAFWVFDALFQPQDHPAREMQDTFFLKQPSKLTISEEKAVEAVRDVHENGGKTGSCGWGYKWQKSKGEQAVLRTHTTATTIHELFKNPNGPRKIFTIGKVFRRETVDYKHLPIFTQVDGIIVDKKATFSDLLGMISIFYKKMGFDKIDFRPGYFPYTEPSLEIYVYLPKKKDWVEMGGAGIFREEVTSSFGCNEPVLAWGLGLERLAMIKYEMESIRDLYLTDIKWLRETPQCR